MSGPPVFALDDEGVVAVDLDGLTAIYHRRSGMTHLVLEAVPAILDSLRDGPCDAVALESRLSVRFDLGDESREASQAVLEARLQELEALGLVRRLSLP